MARTSIPERVWAVTRHHLFATRGEHFAFMLARASLSLGQNALSSETAAPSGRTTRTSQSPRACPARSNVAVKLGPLGATVIPVALMTRPDLTKETVVALTNPPPTIVAVTRPLSPPTSGEIELIVSPPAGTLVCNANLVVAAFAADAWTKLSPNVSVNCLAATSQRFWRRSPAPVRCLAIFAGCSASRSNVGRRSSTMCCECWPWSASRCA